MNQESTTTSANTASNLIVNYIPKEFNDEMLNKLFAPFGEIESARIIRDKVTNETKGFGFVKFCGGESASKAICALQGFEILGKRLKISYSHHNKAPIPLNMMEVLSQQQQQQYRMMTSPQNGSRPNSPQPPQQQLVSPVQQAIQPQIIFVMQQPPSPQLNFPMAISPVALSEADLSVQDSTLPPLSPSHMATSPTLSPTQVSLVLTQQMLQMNHLHHQQMLLQQQQQQQQQQMAAGALDSLMFPFGSFFPMQTMNMMA